MEKYDASDIIMFVSHINGKVSDCQISKSVERLQVYKILGPQGYNCNTKKNPYFFYANPKSFPFWIQNSVYIQLLTRYSLTKFFLKFPYILFPTFKTRMNYFDIWFIMPNSNKKHISKYMFYLPVLTAELIAFSAWLNPSEDPIAMLVICLSVSVVNSSTRPDGS